MKIKTVLLISFLLFITGVSHAERSIQLSGFGGLGYLHWPPLIPSSVPEEYREKLWEQYKKHFVSQVEKKFAEIEGFGIHLDRMTYHFPGSSFLWNSGELAKELHRIAFSHGTRLYPILNVQAYGGDWNRFGIYDTDEYRVVMFPLGEPYYDTSASFCRFCPNHPRGLEVMKGYVQDVVKSLKGAEGFDWLALDDEAGLGYHYPSGQIACYHEESRRIFKEKTGLQPPLLFAPPAGTIIDPKSPLNQWMETIGVASYDNPSMARYNTYLAEAAKEIVPDIVVFQYPGQDGNVDRILWELYSTDGWQAEQSIQMVKALRHKRDLPLSMLIGWFTEDWLKGKHKEAAERIRVNALVSIMHQVDDIGIAPTRCLWEYPEIRETVKEIRGLIDRDGTFFLSLKNKNKKVAILHSTTTKCYHYLLANDAWKQGKIWRQVWPSIRGSHIPIGIITEKQIASGELENYEALLLLGTEYITSDIWEKIERFSRGKPVFYATGVKGYSVTTPLRPDKSTPLDMLNTKAIRDALIPFTGKPFLDFDKYTVFWEHLSGEDSDVVCIINPQHSEVTVNANMDVRAGDITDYFTGKIIPVERESERLNFQVTIPACGWQVLKISGDSR